MVIPARRIYQRFMEEIGNGLHYALSLMLAFRMAYKTDFERVKLRKKINAFQLVSGER